MISTKYQSSSIFNMSRQNIVCLDVGEKRIGVAVADTSIKIAVPFDTLEVDDDINGTILKLLETEQADVLVVGYPRNQSGDATAQTKFVEDFIHSLGELEIKVVFQDESLTSVAAEKQLKEHNRPYKKGDIDALAAAIILQDYLEQGIE